MRALLLVVLVGCAAVPPRDTSGRWPEKADDYEATTEAWTVKGGFRDKYQEIVEVSAVFKSPQWRAARGNRDAYFRGLEGAAREQVMSQARADSEGPYEIELLVTTWDRRENDFDRGKNSVWTVRLIDDQGNEIAPLEIVKDKRPSFTLRSDYPAYGDFAIAYVARFPRDKPVLGEGIKKIRLRISSVRGFVELAWTDQK